MAETVRIRIQTDGGEELAQNLEQASDSAKSLKAQLREITQELQNTDPGTARFSELTQQAGALKDQISDTAAVINATAGGPVENLGRGLQQAASIGIAGMQGLMSAQALFGDKSEALQETLVKLQAVAGMAQAIETLGGLGDAVTNLKAGFGNFFTSVKAGLQGIKGAVAATGIGLLVIAVGVLVAYWDDIKTAVTGVSAEQEKQKKMAEAEAKVQQEKLDTLNSQDNILRLQGLTEKQILEKKIAQTDETIKALEVQMETNKNVFKQQYESAKANKEILKGILTFIQIPLVTILKTIDEIANFAGFESNLAEGLLDWEASFLFDPEGIKKEYDTQLKENEKQLLKLKNDRAGMLLEIKEIDKRDAEERRRLAQENNKKVDKDTSSTAKDRLAAKRELQDAELELMQDGIEKELLANKYKYERMIEDTNLDETKLKDEKLKINEAYAKEKIQQDEVIRTEYKKKEEERLKEEAEKEKERMAKIREQEKQEVETAAKMRDKRIEWMEEGKAKEIAAREAAFQDELWELQNFLDEEKITREEYDELTKTSTKKRNDDIAAINKAYRDAEKEAEAELRDKKIQAVKDTIDTISNLAALFAGSSEKEQRRAFNIQKGAQIAQATIDTYKSATGAYSSLSSIPVVGPALGAAAAAAAITAGLLNIKKIAATQFKASGGGGGENPAAPSIPESTANNLSAPIPDSLSLLGGALGGSSGSGLNLYGSRQGAVRSYVVESDITNTQNTLQTYKQRSEIG